VEAETAEKERVMAAERVKMKFNPKQPVCCGT